MNYTIGQYVEVEYQVKSNYLFRDEDYERHVMKGVVVRTPSWVEYPAVAIKTGNPDIPLSIISERFIVGYTKVEVEGETRAYGVGKYMVTKINGQLHCTCVGFQFRRYCKHSDNFK